MNLTEVQTGNNFRRQTFPKVSRATYAIRARGIAVRAVWPADRDLTLLQTLWDGKSMADAGRACGVSEDDAKNRFRTLRSQMTVRDFIPLEAQEELVKALRARLP